ncbi:hypothetical protein FISHEDRAFT_75082 [Fistulina hepatica ATCC 64428]|uniref:Mitochondrial presequence protease n=1 Tax=Fistulina hepatica ATCC 64428 TaxID=1128425 RepID=A0A0D7A9H1_9AGAR|nr:hypothetical protein FISHEDRAFT_75082 [Fistulina hepatica ATCC 64428]
MVVASPTETYENFDLVKRVKLGFTDVTVSKWTSRVTGLSVVHLDYEAPIVNGYFVIATEIFNDTGCPHTLEHLVFMGSEKYRYKGIIDHLANRGFSNGTNAWTADDHTAYTASTAGGQGFLQLLPIYVDHILYPTLTKAGFITEVHHIDPEGEDSGVVYSEMQGRENTPADLMELQLARLTEPKTSAYRSETGGLMGNLRVLTIEQIREYHSQYYVPHNLSLIVTGKLSGGTASLLRVVQDQVEPSIVEHKQNKGTRPPGWKRPFVETSSAPRPPFTEAIKDTIEFPENDESVGELILNFIGPPVDAFVERKALDILGSYLTSGTVAPLNKEYIEIDSPLCTYIYFAEECRATATYLPIYVGSVPTEHLGDFDNKLKNSFIEIVKKGIDMDRMSMVINRDERQFRSKLESDKGDTFSGSIITDFLYGPEDGSDLEAAMDDIACYNEVRKWTASDWAELLQKYYIDPHSVVLRGKPSADLVERLKQDEKARVAAQRERLGPDGLKEAERLLEEAKKEHDRPIPKEILTSFPVPDVNSIAWIKIQSVQENGTSASHRSEVSASNELSKHIDSDGTPVPFFVQYDHVNSDFVTVRALFSMADVPDRLRPYVQVYIASFFTLPVKRASGECLTHEEVSHKLDDETVSYEARMGIGSNFQETLVVSIKVETAQYETAVTWIKDLVYGAQFDKDRLQVTVAKILQSLPEMRRDGSTMLSAVWTDLLMSEKSTSRAGTILQQTEFIPQLAKGLEEKPDEVIAVFEEIRKHITNPKGIRLGVSGNVLAVSKPRSTWGKHLGQELKTPFLSDLRLSYDTLSDVGKNPVKKAIVLNLPTVETSYVYHTTRAFHGWDHPDLPAIRIASEVLNATESYLWRYIRGSGLAYGASVGLDLESGLLSFSLYRSSNCIGAFNQAATVIRDLVEEKVELEDTTLDAAKSSIVYSVTRNVSTGFRVALTSYVNQALKGLPQEYTVESLLKTQTVTKKDVLACLEKYFLPLFDPKASVAVAVTSPSKVDAVLEGLKQIGYDTELRTLHVDDSEMESDGSESGEESGKD